MGAFSETRNKNSADAPCVALDKRWTSFSLIRHENLSFDRWCSSLSHVSILQFLSILPMHWVNDKRANSWHFTNEKQTNLRHLTNEIQTMRSKITFCFAWQLKKSVPLSLKFNLQFEWQCWQSCLYYFISFWLFYYFLPLAPVTHGSFREHYPI